MTNIIWRCRNLFSDVRSHSLYYCESVMPEIRQLHPIVKTYTEFQELTIEDKEVLTRLLNVFKIVDSDLVKRWGAEDPHYKGWYHVLHKKIDFAINEIEILIED